MAYEIKRYPKRKDGTQTWYVKWVKETTEGREWRHVTRKEWGDLGLKEEMTYDQAKEVTKRLNLKDEVLRQEQRRNAIEGRLKQEQTTNILYLPSHYIDAFEKELSDKKNSKGLLSHWRAAKRLIVKWSTEPKEWARRSDVLYLKMRGISPSYCEKIIRILNDYLEFLSDKTDKFHRLIPYPSGDKKQDLVDGFEESNKPTKESKPLTPEILAQVKQKAQNVVHYNYMHASLWLGLRPVELDKWNESPRKKDTEFAWKLEADNVLVVYQWKLRGIPYDQRWKRIPLLFPDQLTAFDNLKNNQCKKPTVKTIQNWIGEGYNRYAGRKGFEGLMRSLGRKFFEVQAWLGHLSIDRTWRDYKTKNKVVIE